MDSFPFAGIGGLAAIALLVAAYAAFAGLVRVLGAAASGLRLSVVPGIVEGVRDWSRPAIPETDGKRDADAPWEELPPGGAQVGVE